MDGEAGEGVGVGGEAEGAAVTAEDFGDEGQADAAASGFGGEEGGEEASAGLGADAGAVVGDGEGHVALVGGRGEDYASVLPDALYAVFHHVDNDLLEHDGIDIDGGVGLGGGGDDGDMAPRGHAL